MIRLSRDTTHALDLARQPEGYLCPDDDLVEHLIEADLVTAKSIGGGFVIIRAVHIPKKHDRALNWRWYRDRQTTEDRAST
jgi:hypothetical protein